MIINKKIIASGIGLTVLFCLGKSSFAATGTVNVETVRMREAASTDSEIVLNLDENSTVNVLGLEGDWYKVQSGENSGYIHKDFLTVQDEGELTVAPEKLEDEQTNKEETTSSTENNENKQTTENKEEAKTVKVIGNKLNADSSLYLLPTFSSSKIGTVNKDTEIKIVKIISNWSKIQFEKTEAWVPNSKLIELNVEEKIEEPTEEVKEETEKTEINQSGYVNIESANLRKGPSTSYESVAGLIQYETLLIISEQDGWYEVRTTDNMEGYVSKSLVTIGQPVTSRSYVDRRRAAGEQVETEDSTQPVEETAVQENTAVPAANGDVVSTAQQFLGYSYTYGGNSPSTGFDCSGFTSYVYSACGMDISRTSYSQAYDGVAVDDLQPGDLLLFNNGGGGSIGHVGIYVGDGTFIHASNPTGGVKYDTINEGYYASYYAGARRIY